MSTLRTILFLGTSLAALNACDGRPRPSLAPADAGDAFSPSAPSTSFASTRLLRGSVESLETAPVGGARTLVFASTRFEPKVCALDEAGLSCHPLSRARDGGTDREGHLEGRVRLADVEGAEHPGSFHAVVARALNGSGQDLLSTGPVPRVVFASDWGNIDAAVGRNGEVALVLREAAMDGSQYTLHHFPDGRSRGAKKPWTMTLPPEARTVLAFPWLLWSRPRAGESTARLFAMRAASTGSTDPPKEVGVADGDFDVHGACRTSAGIAVAFGHRRLRVLFERGGAWSTVDGGSLEPPRDPVAAFRFRVRYDCVGDDIVASVIAARADREDARYDLRQMTCSPAGCREWGGSFLPLDPPPIDPHDRSARDPYPSLGKVGDQRVLLWESKSGIRMRFGDVEQGPATLPFPEKARNARLFVTGAGAFVLADAGKGDEFIVGLRLGEDGRPLPIARPPSP
jgi:hypothetical protein